MMLGIYYEHMLAAARQREATLPALCAQVRALGYEAVAPQAAHIVRDAGLLPMLSSAGLRAEGIYERFLFESKAQTAQQAAQVLAASERAGARYLLAVLPMLRDEEADRNGTPYARRRDTLATGLEILCAQAAQRGITVLLEPFDSLFSPSAHAAELLWYFARVEGLFCAFDTGNPVVCGEDVERILPALLPYIRIVHAKDRAFCNNGMPGKQTTSGKTVYPAAVGRGNLPLAGIFKTLRQSGFDGTVLAEHFDHADEMGAMEDSARFLRAELLKDA